MTKVAQYLNNSVWCKVGASKIQGVGVIAIRDIPKGTKISDRSLQDMVDGQRTLLLIMKFEELHEIHPAILELILDRVIINNDHDRMLFISPNHDQILQSFMNHSEDPNCTGSIALRDIKAGEEVTESFNSLVKNIHPITKEHMPFLK